jgi:hypothetical protein
MATFKVSIEHIASSVHHPNADRLGEDLTEFLGVMKYEPDAVSSKNAKLFPLSTIGLSMYDIEGADRYPEIVELLMDIPCQITEKLEGANISVTARKGEKTVVASRTNVEKSIQCASASVTSV